MEHGKIGERKGYFRKTHSIQSGVYPRLFTHVKKHAKESIIRGCEIHCQTERETLT